MEQRALLVSDRHADPMLVGTLHLQGFELDIVSSVDSAVRVLTGSTPDLVVVGPLISISGLPVLMRKLGELRIRTVVVTEEPEIVALARELTMLVRAPVR